MKINLLHENYKNNEELYLDFILDRVNDNDNNFSGEILTIEKAPDFPIYMGHGRGIQRNDDFMEAFSVLTDSYIKTDRDVHMNELFWHSLLVTQKRNYILEKYPTVKDSYRNFKNIVIKKFDWENYVYKCVLAAEYIESIDNHCDINSIRDQIKDKEIREYYYFLIIDNLDLYNYMIKYNVFRNGKFILNILNIIDDLGISEIMKAKIENRPDLGKDERYGRRVIFELNKRYPVVMTPLMDYDTLKLEVVKALDNYYDTSEIEIK